jgi:hypothetical protein
MQQTIKHPFCGQDVFVQRMEKTRFYRLLPKEYKEAYEQSGSQKAIYMEYQKAAVLGYWEWAKATNMGAEVCQIIKELLIMKTHETN